jgi:hypothetical protein
LARNADLWNKYLAVRGEAIRLRWEHEGQDKPIEQFEEELVARKPVYYDVCLFEADRARAG